MSGLTLSAHRLADYVLRLGYRVIVVTGRSPQELAAHEVIDGIEVVRSWAPFRIGKALVMPLYWRDVWRALDDVAVVNVHLPCADAATVAIAAKMRNRKLIVSYISSMSTDRFVDRLMRACAAVPHLVAGLLADRIQVVSEDYAQQSVFCRLFWFKLRFAPLPVFLRLLPDEVVSSRHGDQRPDPGPIRLGYVGRIARQKSLDVLLDALPAMLDRLGRKVVLELAGPAEDVVGESYWRDILAKVEKSGGTVRHVGVLHGRALADFYASLDVLVLPSVDRQESFGLVQVEAMLRGVPVVASDLPGMRQPVARSGMGRLFTAGDPSALAEAVIDVVTNGAPSIPDAATLELQFGDDVAAAPYLEMLCSEVS